jgi:hypothetical protein
MIVIPRLDVKGKFVRDGIDPMSVDVEGTIGLARMSFPTPCFGGACFAVFA